ncbi:hypothetical protein [Hyalangium versicolor]|uniref:hypothetical protein n=1 Tax=Hyalangium versicolor TaxID=2861190 RepID=UPI001CCF7DFB|nr:hypothetical protein [Hyalangium versicolor]
MRRLLSIALLLLVACGKNPEGSGGTPDKTPEGDSDSPVRIRGLLVVHVPVRPPSDSLLGAYALLGDGSRFRQPLDENGDARFEDAAIVGPQDISIVFVRPPSDAQVEVYTLLGFNQPEAWLNHPFGSSPQPTKQSTVSGKTTGMSGSGELWVHSVGDMGSDHETIDEQGHFSLDVLGTASGQATLFAQERAVDGDRNLLRVGLMRGITVGGDQPVTGVEIALDHAVDQSLQVGVEGLQAYGENVSADLSHYEGMTELFRTDAFGPLPLQVKTVARTPPFDTTRVMLSVRLGGRELMGGEAVAEMPVASMASAASVKVLAPMLFDSPTVGPKKAPPAVARSGLVVRWSADPEAQMHRLGIGGAAGQDRRITWTVWAPPSITFFTPFILPAEVAPVSTFPTGLHSIEIDAFSRADVKAFEDFFSRDELHDGVVAQRSTKLLRYVDFQ